MKKRFRSLAVVTSAMVAMLAMTVTAAFAQYPPASAFGVSCSASTPGATTSCSIVGAQANEALTATAAAAGDVFFEDTLTADADGEAVLSFSVPSDVEGDVTVTVTGAESGSVADEVTVSQADGDDDDGDDEAGAPVSTDRSLPFTGVEVGGLLAVGVALLAAGLLALRRREDAKVSATS